MRSSPSTNTKLNQSLPPSETSTVATPVLPNEVSRSPKAACAAMDPARAGIDRTMPRRRAFMARYPIEREIFCRFFGGAGCAAAVIYADADLLRLPRLAERLEGPPGAGPPRHSTPHRGGEHLRRA